MNAILELMVLISGKKVLTEIITCRRDNGFHFSPKGKNGLQNAICAPGVKLLTNLFSYSSKVLRFVGTAFHSNSALFSLLEVDLYDFYVSYVI